MYDKIMKLREKIKAELDDLDEGMHLKLELDSRILDMVIFENSEHDYSEYLKSLSNKKELLTYDENGKYTTKKVFALEDKCLQKIDFSNVSFKSFNAYKCDFSKLYGVNINPQELYQKRLEGCILKGVTFTGPFDDVIIGHTDFTGSRNAMINPLKLQGYQFYNNQIITNIEWCIFTDVTFIENFKMVNKPGSYDEIILCGCDFTGSKNAKIYISNSNRSLRDCTLKDATIIIGLCKCMDITGVDFTGVYSQNIFGRKEGITFNPQKCILDFTDTIFNGVTFTGPFTNARINGADFTGSKNALINLSTIADTFGYEKTNFTDATVYDKNHRKLIITEDGRITSSVDDLLDELLFTKEEKNVMDKKAVEEARIKLAKENQAQLQQKINELLSLIDTTIKLGMKEESLYCKIPIEQDLFLVKINDHYEINRNLIDLALLKYFNLSHIDFTNVLVKGIDFRYTAARINPQLVYQKDISSCIFDSTNIKFFDNFDGVNMTDTDFTNCDFVPSKVLTK